MRTPTRRLPIRGGAGSIRVAFRDWIGPWLLLHYLDPVQLAPSIIDFRAKLQPHFTADYFDSVARLKTEVSTLVGDNRGLVGRIRDFQAVHGALDGITVGQPADLVAKVSQTVQQAVVMQQAFEPVQAGTFAASSGKLALDALTGSASRPPPTSARSRLRSRRSSRRSTTSARRSTPRTRAWPPWTGA